MNRQLMTLPGKVTRTGWAMPKDLSKDEWIRLGQWLAKTESGIQWWLGDWWNYGVERQYGDGEEIAAAVNQDYGKLRVYGSVAGAYKLLMRINNLTFYHHQIAMAVEGQRARLKWLNRAEKKGWSANELKAQIARQIALDRTENVELEARRLGLFVVIYADPPWRYENPPMGGSNRSIENHYPTMELDEICAVPVADLAHENSVLFLWATSPKLAECMRVIEAWGFTYRTDMVWIKDKIGMGYHVREKHEGLLIAKRGELPPPDVEVRPSSVVEAPRLEHSAKPPVFRDIIDTMYPKMRKLEMFSRCTERRKNWTFRGNDTAMQQAAE